MALRGNQPVLPFIVRGLPSIMNLEDRGRFREFSECQRITSARLLRARLAPPENPRYGSGGAYSWYGR
ncbi:MAG: hypothetical protein ACJ8AG_30145 [Ktedonobacteraceae bacterium]